MTVREILDRFAGLRALVAGDICLDRWCTYSPALAEPSRETGIDRVAVTGTVITAGAGGTVANNLRALGCGAVSVLGAIGDDGHGYELRQALDRVGADSSLLVTSPLPTFTYTKLLNADTGEEDLGRIDFVSPPSPASIDREIVARLLDAASRFDAILVADQAETESGGVVTPAVREALAMIAARPNAPVILVDSRMRIECFRNVIVKPNEREAAEACARIGATSLRGLRETVGHTLMMVTRGPDGVMVYDGECETLVPTVPVEKPVDICGAGDGFAAGTTLSLAAGAAPVEAARFGNLVTSITIMKKGTGSASPSEVLAAEARL
jgi:rfaE bifunctional protein kinase chain/domain